MLSRDCWEPLVANMASMLEGVGGAANTEVVARVREIRRGRIREGFIMNFQNLNYRLYVI